MPGDGATILGEDGIISVGGNEIPCLTSWSLTTNAELNAVPTRCMKSNGDGGSASAGGWVNQSLGNKSGTLEATFQWQEDDIAAAADLRVDDVGNSVAVLLYPNDSTSGQREISFTGRIESIGIPSTVDGVITQTITIQSDGAITDGTVSP